MTWISTLLAVLATAPALRADEQEANERCKSADKGGVDRAIEALVRCDKNADACSDAVMLARTTIARLRETGDYCVSYGYVGYRLVVGLDVIERKLRRNALEHMVVDHSDLTADDARDPTRVARAFRTIDRAHWFRVARAEPHQLLFVPAPVSRQSSGRAPSNQLAPRYIWFADTRRIHVLHDTAKQLPVGTTVLVWNKTPSGTVVVTPDGGRYEASDLTALAPLGNAPVTYPPALNAEVVTIEDVAVLPTISEPARRAVAETQATHARCRDGVWTRFSRKLDPLLDTRNRLLALGNAAAATRTTTQIDVLSAQRDRALDRECARAFRAVVTAFERARSEHVEARKQAASAFAK